MSPDRVFKFLSLLLFWLFINQANAQDIANMRGKRCLLKGKWQLVSTFSLGADHTVAKDEYDGTIQFLCCHKYVEEVNYESNHWIITGKWKIYRHKTTLLLTHRQYTLGELEKNPADITFELIKLDKANWTASSIAKGAMVKVTYQKIPKKASK